MAEIATSVVVGNVSQGFIYLAVLVLVLTAIALVVFLLNRKKKSDQIISAS